MSLGTISSSAQELVTIAKGAGQFQIVNKFGANRDIDAGETEDIWSTGGNRVYLTNAETMSCVSSSVNDAAAGTGIRTIYIDGLDKNFDQITETVTLNGTTPVVTTNSYLRINRVYGSSAGTGGTNAGAITLDPSSSGAGSRQVTITAGDGQTLIGHYTVPKGKNAYMIGLHYSIGPQEGTTGNKAASVKMYIRLQSQGVWRIQGEANVSTSGTGMSANYAPEIPMYLPEKTDIRFTAISENVNTEVYVQYCLLLENNN